MHRVALDRVAAAHLDGLGDIFGVFARARDGELGQIDVEARGIDARGEVLAHLRRHGTGVLAVLEARQCLIVTDRLDEVGQWSAGEQMMQTLRSIERALLSILT